MKVVMFRHNMRQTATERFSLMTFDLEHISSWKRQQLRVIKNTEDIEFEIELQNEKHEVSITVDNYELVDISVKKNGMTVTTKVFVQNRSP